MSLVIVEVLTGFSPAT